MAEKKKLITSGTLPIDLRGGEEWYGGGVSYTPGPHRFRVLGFEEAEARETKTPMYALVCQILSGPGDSMADAEKSIRRNFTIGSDEALNFFRGMSQKLLGDEWRDGLGGEGEPNCGAYVGIEFGAMIDERSYKDNKGSDRTSYDINFGTCDNVQLPQKKAANVRRPTR